MFIPCTDSIRKLNLKYVFGSIQLNSLNIHQIQGTDEEKKIL